ncbi:MAG: gamma-glutamyltransferase [Gammaproteobacteria bacterium]|nr:gamma-glutamyltransferase [Gammaproteobacteria bacterium]
MKEKRITTAVASWLFACMLISAGPCRAEGAPAHAVASAHPLATAAGVEILREGGNAFDAAIAVSAALGVVEPFSSGFGGGGFWLIHRAADGKQMMIDGRETAPALAHERMYRDAQDNVIRDASLKGPLAAGIPGMPAGLVHLAEHYGRLPLRQSLAPAIRYAEQGFKVTSRYHRLAAYVAGTLRQYPAAAGIFLQDGKPPRIGHVVRQEALARTIEALAENGLDGFYKGPIAQQMVREARKYGGIWSLDDLSAYRVLEREPIVVNYRDVRIVSAPPPSSGGIVMAQALRILEQFDLNAMGGVQRKHHIIEAMRRGFRDRAVFLGDPDFVDVPVARLLDDSYLEGLALTIDPAQATPSDILGNGPVLSQTGTQTTHFSVLDKEGNRVAGTLSVNTLFGSCFVAEGTGVLLNNEMDDFSAKRNTPNAYGLVGDNANAIAPGKRPLSSMTPTFLETPARVGIVGTPGGSRIISMVTLAALDFADNGLPRSWVSLRRFHHQYQPDQLQFELHGLTEFEQQRLAGMGHELKEISRRYGNMQAILWDKTEHRVYSASDPRGEGLAVVVE